MKMKHLYFARHAESELNAAGLIAGGRTETPLTAEGRKQARLAGVAAKNLKIDYIICSPQSRAHETAQIIAKVIGYPADKIHANKLFLERDFGELEGKPWAPDLNLDGFSDIETLDTLLERAKLALELLETIDAKNILVISHGSFGRALRHHITREFPWDHPHRLPNAQIVRWDFTD